MAILVVKAGDYRSRLFFERRYLKRGFRPGPAMVLFLGVYSSGAMAKYPVAIRKWHFKPLKIRPSAMELIDIVLRGSVVTGLVSPACRGFRFCRSFQDDI
jgi:hypothetical protein